MATSILSLFGDVPSNEDMFQRQQMAFQQQLGQATDPRAFIAAVGSNMGSQLGGFASGLLGGGSRQQKIQKVMQAVGNISDPLGQAQAAYEMFQKEGMPREAQMVLESIRGLQKESDVQKRELEKERAESQFREYMSSPETAFETPDDYFKAAKAAFSAGDRVTGSSLMKDYAAAKAAEKTAAEESNKLLTKQAAIQRNTQTIIKLTPNIKPELASGIAADPDLYKEYVKEVFKTNQTKNNVSFQNIDGKVKAVVTNAAGEIVKETVLGNAPNTAPSVKVAVETKGQSAYASTVGTEVAKKDIGILNVAETSAESIPKIQETLTLLKKGDPTTGLGAELMLNINRVKSQFLRDKKAGKKVTDTEYLDALLGSEVFPMISALGIGARGLDTPAEREFLRGVFTGTIAMSKDTLVRLTETRKNIAERAIKRFNDKLANGDFNTFQEATKQKLSPIQLQSGGNATSAGTKYTIIEE